MAGIVQLNVPDVVKCNALTTKSVICNRKIKADGLCGIHLGCRKRSGPLKFGLDQLGIKQRKEARELMDAYRRRDDAAGGDQVLTLENYRVFRRERGDMQRRHHRDWANEHGALRERIAANPDLKREQDEADQRARERGEAPIVVDAAEERRREQEDHDLALRLEAEERAEAHAAVLQLRQMLAGVGGHVWAGAEGIAFAPAAPPPAEPRERGIGDIARDAQSVHTAEVVRHTKEIVAKVLSIPVPEGYRWDREICSKTPGEIITECRLPQKAAHQMMSQYAQDTAIYDIEEGIYGKVLDSVWQFVKGHAEKDSLVTIIRSELTDGVGMCAQGNLTRVCNIVAGYLDGVVFKESIAEKLGRLLPPLAEIANRDVRHTRVLDILAANEVPPEQWDDWIDAVMA